MALKKGVFVEDTKTNPQGNGETVTPADNSGNNNTPPASESVITPKTGRTAQDRIRELVDKVKELEAFHSPNSPAENKTSPDEDWKKKVELEISVPSYLKDKVEDMTAYWSKNPGMNKSEVFKVFTPVDQLLAEAKRADEEAELSRTGGSSNPSARQDTKDVTSMTTDELRAQLEAAVKRGENI
jgi:hypothetical protein